MARRAIDVAAAVLGVVLMHAAPGTLPVCQGRCGRVTVRACRSQLLSSATPNGRRVARRERRTRHIRRVRPPAWRVPVRVEARGFRPLASAHRRGRGDERCRSTPVVEIEAVQEALTVIGTAPRDSVEETAMRESARVTSARRWRRPRRVAAAQGRHRQRRRAARVAEPRPERADRRPAHLRRVSQPDGPAGVSRGLRGGRTRRGGQGALRRALPGQHGRPRQHRHAPAPDGWHASPACRSARSGTSTPRRTASYGGASCPRSAATRSDVGSLHRRTRAAVHGGGELQPTEWIPRPSAPPRHGAGRPGGSRRRPAQASYTRQMADHMLYPYLQMDADYDNADRAALRFEQPRSGRLSAIRADATARAWITG